MKKGVLVQRDRFGNEYRSFPALVSDLEAFKMEEQKRIIRKFGELYGLEFTIELIP